MTTPAELNPANVTASSGSSVDELIRQNGDSLMTDPRADCGGSTLTAKKKSDKKQQFTIKQRMDMYAFCVLEMEINGNRVSIKKQQQAVQKVIQSKLQQQQQRQQQQDPQQQQITIQVNQNGQNVSNQLGVLEIEPQQLISNQVENQHNHTNGVQNNSGVDGASRLHDHNYFGSQGDDAVSQQQHLQQAQNSEDPNKTLSEMKLDLEYKSYSDFQKVLPLTTQMLRDVQLRFAKYYPDCVPPSRTTIKHVFEKCVNLGTVENIKTRRKATKIPQGDEITNLLVNEPQLSLRQMARRLNVSTGTVSRRCKALGLIPDSVTTKHQQLALAKRQKQMKMYEGEQKRKANNGGLTPLKANNNSIAKQNNQTT